MIGRINTQSQGTGDYVLIVDDDVDARIILGTIVENIGIAVRHAADGRGALQMLLDNDKAILILLDLMMPQMSGFDVLRRLIEDPRLRRIPVIVVTALSTEELRWLNLPGVRQVLPKGNITPTIVRGLVLDAIAPRQTASLKIENTDPKQIH